MDLEIISNIQPPGINKLLRMHYRVRKKLQAEIAEDIAANYPLDLIEGPVTVDYLRKSVRLMDWDNAAGSFKLIGDALVQLGILEDDNPTVIKEFRVEQERVSRLKGQGYRVYICQTSAM